jgi:transposase
MRLQGEKIMIWGAISGKGLGPLRRIEGSIDQHRYLQLLQEIRPFLCQPRAKFVQDNAPAHNAIRVKEWLSTSGIRVVPWPSLSPDLNPIENVWAIVKRRIGSPSFSSTEELWQATQTAWNSITTSEILKIVDSMKKRISMCIALKGGPISY